jgi:hypothetical protein
MLKRGMIVDDVLPLSFGHVMVTTVQRVRVKTYLTAICYNLVRARFLDRIA